MFRQKRGTVELSLRAVLDAGKRTAQVAQAEAALDESGSAYSGVVRAAFQQVEDRLALAHHYQTAALKEHSAIDAVKRSLGLSLAQYRDRATSYLELVTS